MQIVDPLDGLRGGFNFDVVEVDDYRILAGAHQDTGKCLVATGIYLLMWHEWGHMNEVTRTGFSNELQPRTPAHSRRASDNVNHTLHRPVMMGTCGCTRMNIDGARP